MQKCKHFILTTMTVLLASLSVGITSMGAAQEPAVDTIVLEPETAAVDEVLVDLSWKTQQDNGKWIEELGIAGDTRSLVLVINNLNSSEESEIPIRKEDGTKVRVKNNHLAGNSRLHYYSKDTNDQWCEVFSVNCYISGGTGDDEDIYGVYRLESAFGNEEDPGSLVPYHRLKSNDYWITDPDAEGFGSIYTAEDGKPETESCVRLEEMKAFSNYGMILKPEEEGGAYPALVVNCQQASTNDNTFSGIQLSQSYVRMLIQSIDPETRIMIAGEVEDLEGM